MSVYDPSTDSVRGGPSAEHLLRVADGVRPVAAWGEESELEPGSLIWAPKIGIGPELRAKVETAAAVRGMNPGQLLATLLEIVFLGFLAEERPPARPMNRKERHAARRAARRFRQ